MFLKIKLTIGLLFTMVLMTEAQTAHKLLREGDAAFHQEQYNEAEEAYRKALEEEGSNSKASYNLGNTIYKSSKDRLMSVIDAYQQVIDGTKDPRLKADAQHNIGNAYYLMGDYQKSVDAYKEVLKVNPKAKDSRHNFMLARQKLQQQQKEQQQKDKQQQEQEGEKQQQQQENQNGENDKNDPKQDPNTQQQQQQNQQQEQKAKKKLSQEQLKELLKVMEEEEKKVQQKLRKIQTEPSKSDKDW